MKRIISFILLVSGLMLTNQLMSNAKGENFFKVKLMVISGLFNLAFVKNTGASFGQAKTPQAQKG